MSKMTRDVEDRQLMVSLNDIEKIDVDKHLDLVSKVQYQPVSFQKGLMKEDNKNSDPNIVSSGRPYSTIESLFATQMRSMILDKLAALPERPYSSARLLICDRDSYDAILKLQRIYNQQNKSRHFIYGPPYNVTAVFLVEDVVDILDRTKKPLILMKHSKNLNKKIGQFNYPLIKETFPFLKMTDLIVFMNDTSSLDANHFQVGATGGRNEQFLQFLAHYARSNYSIDLQPITKQTGFLHQIYENVSILLPINDNKIRTDHYKPSLPMLSSMAHRLTQLADTLGLRLQTITYRAGDPNGFTKIFTQLVASNLNIINTQARQKGQQARVLVIDRFFDLQSLLYHSELYGPFVEQEMSVEANCGGSTNDTANRMPTLDLVDDLDNKLQFEKLTEVLNSILKYTVDLKPTDEPSAMNREVRQINRQLCSSISTSQAIRRHMDIVRVMYKHLNEGYLLILKLESSLLDTMNQLRALNEPLPSNKQDQLADRLLRMVAAFKQLAVMSGRSIRPLDLIRIACILVDVINVFVYIHSRIAGSRPASPKQADVLSGACKVLHDVKSSSLFGGEFRSSLKSKTSGLMAIDKKAEGKPNAQQTIETRDDEDQNTEIADDNAHQTVDGLMAILEVFDAASMAFCGQRATMTLQDIIQSFMDNQLDQESYPTLSLSAPTSDKSISSSSRSPLDKSKKIQKTSTNAVVVVVFLGSITYDEVSRIKVMESTLARKHQKQQAKSDIFLLACGLRRPEDFLKAL